MTTHLAEISFQLAYPWALLLLGLIPFLALIQSRQGRQGAVTFSSLHILEKMGRVTKGRFGGFRLVGLFLSLLCLILALARPQSINRTEHVSESGIELIIAIDVSLSMQAEDFTIEGSKANRLQAAKKVTRDFIKGRKSDRIGILAFAGRPYLASPLTLSKSWLEGPFGLGRVRIGLVEDGTAIGSAIAASAKRLDKRPSKSKIIVLLTDGVNNAGKISPIEAAKLAKTLGIKVYTIAVGTYGDSIIPTPQGPYRLHQEFDEKTLQQIATIADGSYFRAQDTTGLKQIFDAIDQMETSEVKRHTTIHATELFFWPALAAILFCIITLTGNETVWRRFP